MRVAICGGGVAAVEALLGLRAFLGRAARVDLIAPNRCFVYEPLAVAEPFGPSYLPRKNGSPACSVGEVNVVAG
jgi:NADH dehydrogenase FAD-containing subunit